MGRRWKDKTELSEEKWVRAIWKGKNKETPLKPKQVPFKTRATWN
jgi:hypothetical protein